MAAPRIVKTLIDFLVDAFFAPALVGENSPKKGKFRPKAQYPLTTSATPPPGSPL